MVSDPPVRKSEVKDVCKKGQKEYAEHGSFSLENWVKELPLYTVIKVLSTAGAQL
jgi:hypothetical protein